MSAGPPARSMAKDQDSREPQDNESAAASRQTVVEELNEPEGSHAEVPPDPPFSKGFWDNDPVTTKARKAYLKVCVMAVVLVSLTIWAVLPMFWGSEWKPETAVHNLNGWIVLEAAWWVSALKAFEQTYEQTFRSSSTLFTSQDESERWEECKLLLIDEVERSERAAFAGKRGRDGDAEEEWEWEEMIGCWVRKTESPGEARMPKRRKLKRVVPQPVREEDDYSSTLACSDPLALPGAETSSPDPIASFTKARAVALSDIGSPCPKALNGTRAHARSSSSPAEIAPIGSARYLPDSDSPESNPWVVNAIEPELPTVDLFPSSDDTLDLFAYGSSSP
ncbi:hypothetical protein GLOTRDRAFT_127905 [Gloeophyllum trabeum ATCC 11539]|uniref:Uncharacterized protein n=1 Tax=Gloeophyllum trabeum (strain ATCC 11539 / FP-39264 / Madison 617) TaxID=670483 RepID=S7QE38_GLOTA|nr:uncharacterized protein GLOTRDRAFT_127905 [Gloeophyllum trabeum ATCC 11539]EPQ57553.1 hypothetical protein GLOTRDRAFT_127905 [Gloeophyllum trabeum ATCC 11539]